jgi:hypothetical protein
MGKEGLSLREACQGSKSFTRGIDVFQLKEIEKLASKRGVVLQSVDVVQSIIDDDMVAPRLASSTFVGLRSGSVHESTTILQNLRPSASAQVRLITF